MYELVRTISEIAPPFNMIVFVVLIGTLGGIIGTVVKQVRKYASHHEDLQLKREMVERGLSAEEIERIFAAKSPVGSNSDD